MTRYRRAALRCTIALACGCVLFAGISGAADAPAKVRLLVDTDIGSFLDDAAALAFLIASPEADLAGVTTVGEDAETRAWIARRLLTQAGRRETPVAFGRDQQPKIPLSWSRQYRNHPALIFSRMSKPVADPAASWLLGQLKAAPGQFTILALGPLTNVARLLNDHPECKPWIKQIVVSGGALHVGYEGKPPVEAEANVRADVAAARAVLASGVPVKFVPLDVTSRFALDGERRDKLFGAYSPLTMQLQALWQLADRPEIQLFDVVAAALALDEKLATWEPMRIEISDDGRTRLGDGQPNVQAAVKLDRVTLLDRFVSRIAAQGQANLPKPTGPVSEPVARTGLPVRVHAFEDYETDIERRWWMSGVAESQDVPEGSRRACRSVLTQDFDDLQGDMATMSAAVVFNPVPGPPMGPRTRLSFRYKLAGTDTIRVQLYSLSNGYHRCLRLVGLPQGKWQEATVDMREMRRPDGTGGPLSADERIDDIQFYLDPRAEVLIDDVALYEAAPDGEKRPFPRRIIFSAWFDTGKQGQEWPGDFEIVKHDPPRGWKFARSVAGPDGKPWIRLCLRGLRPLAPQTRLRFWYKVEGADAIQLKLVNAKEKQEHAAELKGLKPGEWAEAEIDFKIAAQGSTADELHLMLPAGAQLDIDDLLLYEAQP